MNSISATMRGKTAAGILAVTLSFAGLGYANAQTKPPQAPAAGEAEGMGAMQKQMMHGAMHQMETCMERMGKMNEPAQMDEAARKQMHTQMMARMQSCMSHVKPGEATAHSGDDHDPKKGHDPKD